MFLKIIMLIFLLIFFTLIIKNRSEKFTDFKNKKIVHYCVGSYEQNNYGGVARYDYQIKLAFPNRIFFQGPRDKNKMLDFLEKCKNPLVITDNHLSLDIPNKYKIILVHHGVANTHALRDPNWTGKLRDSCVNGQKKMLDFQKIGVPKTMKFATKWV